MPKVLIMFGQLVPSFKVWILAILNQNTKKINARFKVWILAILAFMAMHNVKVERSAFDNDQ